MAPSVANGSFEATTAVGAAFHAASWSTEPGRYELTVDTAQRKDGRASLQSRHTGFAMALSVAGRAREEARISQSIRPGRAGGAGLRLTGWIRTEDLARGHAGLWIRVDSAGRTLWADDMSERAPRGTTPWARYAVDIPVPAGATRVTAGAYHMGTGTAWFDALALEVIPPPPPRSWDPRAYVPPPRPAEDLDRLLSDPELARAEEPAPPAVDSVAAAWVRAHARPVRSLGARDATDLEFLRSVLAGKRVVQLGENSHGAREYSLLKARLVRHLHERLGYDVLAFESPLFGCDRAGRRASALSADSLLRACPFRVWRTEEVLPLMEYVRETQRTARPLVLTGFDVQTDGRRRSEFLQYVVATADRAYAAEVYATDSAAASAMRGVLALTAAERDRFVAFYDALAGWLRARERRLVAAFPGDPTAPLLARQVAASMAAYVHQRASADGMEQVAARDRGMADNLDFLLDELHPGKKVIVWAHNGHVRHGGFAPGVTADRRPYGGPRMMGTYLAERRRAELYTIGLYMYRGSVADLRRQPAEVPPAPAGSLEAILHRAPWRYAFLDLAHAPPGPGTRWMSHVLDARDGGGVPYATSIVPRDEYDGLLFVDTTWPPQYRRSPTP